MKKDIINNTFKTPILFMVYNRPEQTIKVLDSIRKIEPAYLYISSDGPKNSDDKILINQIRSILKEIEWNCEVKTLFNETNLGCKKACNQAIDWFFSQEKEGIILEDDCLPNQSFFYFCSELLELYRDDKRIAMISGNLPYQNVFKNNDSYCFSRYTHLWGWASWRRSWELHDKTLSFLVNFKDFDGFKKTIHNVRERKYWEKIANKVNSIDTWDYPLLISYWSQSMLSIVPNVNLVSNIGFGEGATHTKNIESNQNNIKSEEIKFPLTHPKFIIANKKLDDLTVDNEFSPSLIKRIMYKLNKFFKLNIL